MGLISGQSIGHLVGSSRILIFPRFLQSCLRDLLSALLSINMKAIWRTSFLKSREQADQCNNFGETEEVVSFWVGMLPILQQINYNFENRILEIKVQSVHQSGMSFTEQVIYYYFE